MRHKWIQSHVGIKGNENVDTPLYRSKEEYKYVHQGEMANLREEFPFPKNKLYNRVVGGQLKHFKVLFIFHV